MNPKLAALIESNPNPKRVSFDFSTKRFDSNVIPIIIWSTFACFVMSIGMHWLFKYGGIAWGEQIADWMFNHLAVDPGKMFSEPWRLVTNMFMHGGLLHFGMNMLMLHMFYMSAKEFFPGKTWLIVYFVGGIAGALAFGMLNEPGKLAVGASGGVMALWGAAIAARIRYARVPADERPWQSDLTLKKLLAFAALQFATEFLIPNVAHSAHIGGMLVGFAIGYVLPLWQQPRIVASREGLFTLVPEMKQNRLGFRVHGITLVCGEHFDENRDFAAVEYDRVDWLGRRAVWYEALCGKMPANVAADNVVFVASASHIGHETTDQFVHRVLKDNAPVTEELKKPKKQESYAVTAGIVILLLLNQFTLDPQWFPLIALASAVVAFVLVFSTFENRTLRAASRLGLVMLVLFAGGYGIGALIGHLDTVVVVMVSLVAGNILQRFAIGPVMARFNTGPEVA